MSLNVLARDMGVARSTMQKMVKDLSGKSLVRQWKPLSLPQ